MKINVNIKHQEGYLLTELDIKETTGKDAPIAFIVHDLYDVQEEYRYFNGKLYTKAKWIEKHSGELGEKLLSTSKLHLCIEGMYDYWNYTKEDVVNSYIKDAEKYLIIDGVVYKKRGEPRYVVMTFGLGNNHGGTSLIVSNWYNPNISKDRYFNASEKKKAIKYTKEIAARRGDTDFVDRVGKLCSIEVLIPEAIKCNRS